jgi:hypothetical protein
LDSGRAWTDAPASLRRLLEEEERESVAQLESRPVAARLRTWWFFWCVWLESWQPSERQMNRCDFWVKVIVIAVALYLFLEVGVAFLPGGAVDRLLGGVR